MVQPVDDAARGLQPQITALGEQGRDRQIPLDLVQRDIALSACGQGGGIGQGQLERCAGAGTDLPAGRFQHQIRGAYDQVGTGGRGRQDRSGHLDPGVLSGHQLGQANIGLRHHVGRVGGGDKGIACVFDGEVIDQVDRDVANQLLTATDLGLGVQQHRCQLHLGTKLADHLQRGGQLQRAAAYRDHGVVASILGHIERLAGKIDGLAHLEHAGIPTLPVGAHQLDRGHALVTLDIKEVHHGAMWRLLEVGDIGPFGGGQQYPLLVGEPGQPT